MGPDKARTASQKLFTHASWDLVISSGFAGALDVNPVGTVLIGHEVHLNPFSSHLEGQQIQCDPGWIQTALNIDWKGQHSLGLGSFVSLDHVVTNSSDKQRLGRAHKAVAVDMESAAVGKEAQDRRTPFLIVRTISDGVMDDLPVDFNIFLKPWGWVSGTYSIVTTPKSWKGLLHLYHQSKQAATQLTQFFEAFLSVVSDMPTSTTSLPSEA